MIPGGLIMPMGPGPVGLIAFVGVKFTGYSLAAYLLNRAYEARENAWKVGAARTAIGIAAGAAYLASWNLAHAAPGMAGWLLSLVPVRLAEWGLLLRIFFDKRFLATPQSWRYAALGSRWSYALDAVGLAAAWVVPGGFWVC
jgi:hypothetical protein